MSAVRMKRPKHILAASAGQVKSDQLSQIDS